MTTPGSEYEEVLRVAELLERMSGNVSRDSTPAVVWIFSPEDESENASCEANLFQNEGIGLALRKFRTYRVNVNDVPSERLRKEYGRTPSFCFFDPAGKLVAKTGGKKVSSLSGFSKALNATWSKSFTSRLRDYQKRMTKILDRLDRVSGRQQVLDQSRARLEEKPNPRKQRELDREEAEIEKLAAAIAADEKKVLDSVKLKDAFLPDEAKEELAKRR